MLIAVLADSHDSQYYIKKAVDIINRRDVSFCLHCGDIVLPSSLELFKKLKIPFQAVFGNNDIYHKNELLSAANGFCNIDTVPFELEVGNKKILMLHEPYGIEDYVQSQKYDFIFYAHTHRFRFYKEGKTLILNPGELCGTRSGRSTFAIVDITSGNVEIIDTEIE
ncbi:MAG: metallophosphoesterase [Elusimicrobia bacterium]|nr:metallophosphoesterase [Elusimicrobiota bacterium]